MKKVVVILLIMMYGFSSSGMSVQLHFCCGKLKSIDWFAKEERTCGMSHMMGSAPCCETKEVSHSEKSDHLNSVAAAVKPLTAPAELERHHERSFTCTSYKQIAPFSDTSPPEDDQYSFIRNRVFRI